MLRSSIMTCRDILSRDILPISDRQHIGHLIDPEQRLQPTSRESSGRK